MSILTIALYSLRYKNILTVLFVIPGLILKKLQIIKSMNLEQGKQGGTNERLKISFDLYLPTATFRKASPGLPNYRITIVGYS
jgi:hypothetical protein